MSHSLITLKDISLYYNQVPVFEEFNLALTKNQKIGFVGINGSGKTTMMKILAGELEIDSGEILKANGLKISYLPQDFAIPKNQTIRQFLYPDINQTEEYLHYEEKIAKYLPLFGFTNLEQNLETLSGGLQRQVLILKAVASEPDVLLLDEPTNHLDLLTLENFKKLLQEYQGCFLLISHDRYFMDQVVNQIWELDNGRLFKHKGNYSDYLISKEERYQTELKQHEKLRQELKRELEWVNSGVKARGTKDQGRLNRYWELKEEYKNSKPKWHKPYLPLPKITPLGNKILKTEELEVYFPDTPPNLSDTPPSPLSRGGENIPPAPLKGGDSLPLLKKDEDLEISLRKPSLEDVQEMIQIQKETYIKNYVNDKYKATLEEIEKQDWELRKQEKINFIKDKNCYGLVLEKSKKILGYGFVIKTDRPESEIRNLIIKPEYQKLGYGSLILKNLISNTSAKKIIAKTTVADKFYEKFGFKLQNIENLDLSTRNEKTLQLDLEIPPLEFQVQDGLVPADLWGTKRGSVGVSGVSAPLIKNLNLEFTEGMRLGLLGPNGCGKTTLIKALLGDYKNKKGKIIYGQNTEFNYQDQKRMNLFEEKSLMYNISENNLKMKFGTTTTNVYAYLKKFLFSSDDLKKPVATLSGGQRARLLLAKILKKGGNFLILDEPTNDLDLDTLEALENSLLEFEGCCIIVSHDRFFLDRVCTHVLAFEKDGNYILSDGGYTDYLKKYGQTSSYYKQFADELEENSKSKIQKAESKESGKVRPLKEVRGMPTLERGSGGVSIESEEGKTPKDLKDLVEKYKDSEFVKEKSKIKKSKKELRQEKAQQKELERKMEKLEKKIKKLELQLADPKVYSQGQAKISEIYGKIQAGKKELEELEEEWLEVEG